MKRSDGEKLFVDVLKSNMDTYHKMEAWGASLFLGGLALMAKQLMEWDSDAARKLTHLNPWVCVSPALAGLAGFVFMRVVNFRGHDTSKDLMRVAQRDDIKGSSFGILGLLFALMPVALGFATSWVLTSDRPSRTNAMAIANVIGAAVVLAGFIVHFTMRFIERRQLAGKGVNRFWPNSAAVVVTGLLACASWACIPWLRNGMAPASHLIDYGAVVLWAGAIGVSALALNAWFHRLGDKKSTNPVAICADACC